MEKKEAALLIFIKNAKKGKVKTRLAATLGQEKALQIYEALLDHTRKVALSVEVERYLFYSDYIHQNDAWSNRDFVKLVQEGSDLGARISAAFASTLPSNQKVVIIGSDCASLTHAILEEAFDQLDDYPFVLGPAVDGGYYLLGMKDLAPSIFRGIDWSTEKVFAQTVQKMEALGKPYYRLPVLSDIDVEADWERHGWDI